MKNFWKYFFLFFFLHACKGSDNNRSDHEQTLYSDPLVVKLNTSGGYSINKITGDSIGPLLDSNGVTVKTGVAIPLTGKTFSDIKLSRSKNIKEPDLTAIIPTNVHRLINKPQNIPVDTTRLKKIKLGEGDRSFALRNSNGIIPTGVAIPVSGKIISCKEPKPIKALPLRIKDGATEGIQYLDVDQGLSFPYLYSVLEDKNGNLWFGTDGLGISKYNGINFTNYSIAEGLSGGTITSMIEDRKGNLWIGTENGVTKFDGKIFTQFTAKEGLAGNIATVLTEDYNGNLWFGSDGFGATKYDGKNFTHFTTREGLPSNQVLSCIEDSRGNLWFGTSGGAAMFDGKNFTYYTQQNGLPQNSISTLFEDKKKNLWFGSNAGGLTEFDGKNFTNYKEKEGLSNTKIYSITEDHDGNIWICTLDGLNKYDGKNFTTFKQQQGLLKNKILKVIEDRNENIWFATEGGGVNKLSSLRFSYLLPQELFRNLKVRPVIKDRSGNLWFGTETGGLGKFNIADKKDSANSFFYYSEKNGLPAVGQRSLLQDRGGNIWIGTTGTGIYKFDGKYFTNYSANGIPSQLAIYDMLEDKNGDLWFGISEGAILRFDGKKFILYDQKNGLPGTINYSMLQDKKGNIWFCSRGGLTKYDGKNIINYSEKEGLFCKEITSIAEDEKGYLWLGTLGAGICKFDGKEFIYYREQQGLSNNNVWSVFHDSTGKIWVGTDKGLNLFIPKKNDEKNYFLYKFGFQDGLRSLDFNLHGVCVDDDHRIWWGTGKGVASLDLSKEFKVYTPRSLSINYIEINGQFLDFTNVETNNKITFSNAGFFDNYPNELSLSYDNDHITFHFSAIDWSAPDKIKYSYRLIGLDEKWSDPSEETVADYRNLSHGKYEFQVKAIGQSQIWTQAFIYSFIVRPAWWQTWAFKIFVVLASLLTVLFIARLIYLARLRKQRISLEKQLAVQFERQRISSEMHDDVGAGLSGIRLLTEMAKSKVADKQAVEEIEKIHASVGNISANMKEVIWSLETANDTLENLINFIQKQVKRLLENYSADLSIEAPSKIPSIIINGNDRRNIYLVVKESIHNIIKHSGADKISVSISCDEKLIIVISDNGRGMNVDQNNDTGNGMKNLRRRIEQLNGEMNIKNKNGVELTFQIPLKKNS